MIGELAYPFMAGAIAMANPCGFALLPAYIARRLGTGGEGREGKLDAVLRALGLGAAATVGLVLVIGFVGGAISLGAYWLVRALPWIGLIIGMVLMIIGLIVVAGKHIRVPLPAAAYPHVSGGLGGDFSFGIGYGAASLSCTLPIFLAVTSTAMTGSMSASILSFLAYALGMGTILMSLAIGAALSRGGLAGLIKRAGAYFYRVSGGVLFLAGAYVAYYVGYPLFASGMPDESSLIMDGLWLSGRLRNWLDGPVGQPILFGLLALLAVLSAWAILRRILPVGGSNNPGSHPQNAPPGHGHRGMRR